MEDADDCERISAYTTNGFKFSNGIASNRCATSTQILQKGNIVIVKDDENNLNVLIK